MRYAEFFAKIVFIGLCLQVLNSPLTIKKAHAIQTGTPTGDVSTGSWDDETPGGALYDSIDEASADGDTTYIVDAATNTTAEVSFSSLTDPGVDTGHEIHIWIRSIGSKGPEKLDVALYQSTTLIEEFANQSNNSATYAEKTLALSEANVANITDYSDLRIRMTGDSIGSGEEMRVTKAELQIPDVASALTVDIVNSGGTPVGSPSLAMSAIQSSFAYQTPTGTFGVSEERIRITNTTASPAWTLTVAATDGNTATWSTGSAYYDFNDSGGSGCTDGADTDGYAGQMTQDPSSGTITPEAGCSTTGLSLGSSTAFDEGTTDSITLLAASASADTNCYWDLTGISVSQKIPSEQGTGSYSINMTLTAAAS